MSIIAVFALISGLLLDTIASQGHEEASLGDVMIKDGLVKIYYTDGTRNASWDGICSDYGSSKTIGTVICRQLGYQDVSTAIKLKKGNSFDSGAVVHSFNCGDDPTYSHILQCSHTVSQTCNNELMSIKCKSDKDLPNLFDGQVRLCSPRDFPNGTQSASTGLVLINLHGEWRGINQLNSSYPLGTRVADSVCRQLGYTGAVVNSAKPWNATSEDYRNCYQGNNIGPAAWFTTDDSRLQCSGSVQDCVGCCFPFPPHSSDHCTNCTNTTDVVITCTYDPTILRGKAVTGWSARDATCSFSGRSSLQHSACTQQEIPLRTFEITVGSVGSAAVLLFIILTVTITVISVWFCRARRGHGGRQLVRPHEDPDEN